MFAYGLRLKTRYGSATEKLLQKCNGKHFRSATEKLKSMNVFKSLMAQYSEFIFHSMTSDSNLKQPFQALALCDGTADK